MQFGRIWFQPETGRVSGRTRRRPRPHVAVKLVSVDATLASLCPFSKWFDLSAVRLLKFVFCSCHAECGLAQCRCCFFSFLFSLSPLVFLCVAVQTEGIVPRGINSVIHLKSPQSFWTWLLVTRAGTAVLRCYGNPGWCCCGGRWWILETRWQERRDMFGGVQGVNVYE